MIVVRQRDFAARAKKILLHVVDRVAKNEAADPLARMALVPRRTMSGSSL